MGRNRTWEYYFVVVPSGERLDGGQVPQNTFRAVQTSPPRSVLASLSAASALSTAMSTSRSSTSQQPQATEGSLQNSSSTSGDGFPKWAIAVITILGVLLVLTLLGIAIALLRRRTRRHDQRLGSAASEGSVPDAVGISSGGSRKTHRQGSHDEKEPSSASHGGDHKNISSVPPPLVPVLLSRASPDQPPQDRTRSPTVPAPTNHRPASRTSLYPPIITSPPSGAGSRDTPRQRSASYTATASSHSDQGSLVSPTSGRLSGVEAAAVADAFRQAMRKPDFADM